MRGDSNQPNTIVIVQQIPYSPLRVKELSSLIGFARLVLRIKFITQKFSNPILLSGSDDLLFPNVLKTAVISTHQKNTGQLNKAAIDRWQEQGP